MIKSIQTWGEAGYENLALSALNSLSGLPGFYLCQDPGCFLQITPQEKDGKTTLEWEFGVVGVRVTAMGHFEGCSLGYLVASYGSRGGYSETIHADKSDIFLTFSAAQKAVEKMNEKNAAAISKVYCEVGITPCLIIE